MFCIYIDGKRLNDNHGRAITFSEWDDANETAWSYRLTHHKVAIVKA